MSMCMAHIPKHVYHALISFVILLRETIKVLLISVPTMKLNASVHMSVIDKPKSGRIPQIPLEISTRIRKTLRESRQGWTTKQVNDLIVNESGIHYHYTHVYRLLYKWGFKQKVPRKVHVNTASKEEKEEFKKEQRWF